MLSKLKWDVAGVTAHDFLPLLLSRLPLRGVVNTEMVQRHAQTFIALAARGESQILDLPCLMAGVILRLDRRPACSSACVSSSDWTVPEAQLGERG